MAATTPASNGGPWGAITSDDTRGAIQPIISTGIGAPAHRRVAEMLAQGDDHAYRYPLAERVAMKKSLGKGSRSVPSGRGG